MTLAINDFIARAKINVNDIDASLDNETKEISIKQKFTYFNSSDSTLNELYFNDWNHAYSGKNTSLAKRFGDYCQKIDLIL